MKKYILLALTLALFASPAQAITVTCTNCSTNLVQMLDRITNMWKSKACPCRSAPIPTGLNG